MQLTVLALANVCNLRIEVLKYVKTCRILAKQNSIMSTQGTIKRYILIIEKINDSKYPSLQDIREHLRDQGFEISNDLCQKDLVDFLMERLKYYMKEKHLRFLYNCI